MELLRFVGRWWTAFALAASVAMLATAHAFERIGGYPPCHLCLKQREVYWFAIIVALPAVLWALFSQARRTPRLAAFLLFGVFATGAIVAAFHAGGELGWWKLPASCTGTVGSVSIDELVTALSGQGKALPACNTPLWSFAGVSMAGWNAIVSAVLAVLSLIASRGKKELRRGIDSVVR